MRARLLLVAVSGLSFAAAAAAEPAKAPIRKAEQPAEQAAPIVIASAEEVRTPVTGQDSGAPAKRERKARVTTCRCGGEATPDN